MRCKIASNAALHDGTDKLQYLAAAGSPAPHGEITIYSSYIDLTRVNPLADVGMQEHNKLALILKAKNFNNLPHSYYIHTRDCNKYKIELIHVRIYNVNLAFFNRVPRKSN